MTGRTALENTKPLWARYIAAISAGLLFNEAYARRLGNVLPWCKTKFHCLAFELGANECGIHPGFLIRSNHSTHARCYVYLDRQPVHRLSSPPKLYSLCRVFQAHTRFPGRPKRQNRQQRENTPNRYNDRLFSPREQRNIASADMVEVSVVLAEAFLLEREGTALRKRQQQQQHRAGGRPQGGRDDSASGTAAGAGAVAGAGAAEAAVNSEEMARQCWDDEREAENRRRMDILSRSLEASDIQDLQVLRRSLQRQVERAARTGQRGTRGLARGERSLAGRTS